MSKPEAARSELLLQELWSIKCSAIFLQSFLYVAMGRDEPLELLQDGPLHLAWPCLASQRPSPNF